MPKEERPEAGQKINQIKVAIQKALEERKSQLQEVLINEQLKNETVDITLPGRGQGMGSLHPITLTLNRIQDYFKQFGFVVEEGPEIEDEFHNFEALNIPELIILHVQCMIRFILMISFYYAHTLLLYKFMLCKNKSRQ